MNDDSVGSSVQRFRLAEPVAGSDGDLLSALREVESAAFDFALIHLENGLDRALRDEKIGSKLLAGLTLAIFIAAGAYGFLFELMSFFTLTLWPGNGATIAGLVSHGVIFLVAAVCLFRRRLYQFGRNVADAAH